MWALAACLYAAAIVFIYFDGYDVDRSAYESGELSGVAFRWVSVGLVLGLVANILLARRRSLAPSWSAVTRPGAYVCAAVLSLGLALASGAPATEAEEHDQDAASCAENQGNPAESLPAGSVRELSQNEIELLSGQNLDGGPENWQLFAARGGTLVSTLPVGDDEEDQLQTRAGFVDGSSGPSDNVTEADIGGLRATLISKSDGRLLIYGQVGCYGVTTAGPPPSSRRLAAEIFKSAD